MKKGFAPKSGANLFSKRYYGLAVFASFRLTLRTLYFAKTSGGFPATLIAGFFIMLMGAEILENTALHGHLLKFTKGTINVVTLFEINLSQKPLSFPTNVS